MDYTTLKAGDKIKLTGYMWDSWEHEGFKTGSEMTIASVEDAPIFRDRGGVGVTFEEFTRPENKPFFLVNLGVNDDAWSAELVQ